MGPFRTPHSTAYSHVIIMFASFQIESPFAATVRHTVLNTPDSIHIGRKVSKIHR